MVSTVIEGGDKRARFYTKPFYFLKMMVTSTYSSLARARHITQTNHKRLGSVGELMNN